MANHDTDKASTRRLKELERRLEGAFRNLSNRGSVAGREGESLRARRARLSQQLHGGHEDPGAVSDLEALSEDIDAWIGRLDRGQTHHDMRAPSRRKD